MPRWGCMCGSPTSAAKDTTNLYFKTIHFVAMFALGINIQLQVVE